MNIRLKRTPGLYLVGFMGCGKTTIGRLAAARLGWSFADLDDDIEAAEGATISEIFAKRGEAEFRRIEAEALRARVCEIATRPPHGARARRRGFRRSRRITNWSKTTA